MKHKSFDTLLKDAILSAAEEQGRRLDAEPVMPVPETAQARFDAAMDKEERTAKEPTAPEPRSAQKPSARTVVRRWLAYGLTAAALAAVVLVIALMIRSGSIFSGKPKPGDPIGVEATPESTDGPGKPLPYTAVTYRDTEEAEAAMRQMFAAFSELIEKVRDDLNEPEHRVLKGGVLYVDRGVNAIDWEHPCAETTEAIQRLLQFPGGRYFYAGWERTDRVPVFFLTVYWTNETGYYQTSLVFSEDPEYLYANDPAAEDVTPEPLTEDRTWAIYSERWQEAPFEMEPDPAPAPEPKPYVTNFVNPGPDVNFGSDLNAPVSEMQGRAKAFLKQNREALERAGSDLSAWNEVIARSDEPNASVFLADASAYFAQAQDPMTVVAFPWAIDTTRTEAGELYELRLLYVQEPSEQINDLYRDALIPLEEHWYLLTVYYVRSTLPGVWTMPDRYGYGTSYLELHPNGTARVLETTYDARADEQCRFDADPELQNGLLFSKGTLLRTAVYDPETDTLTVRFSDGSERTATRAYDLVLPRRDPLDRSARTLLTLPVSCPVGALDAAEGQMFLYDVDGDGALDPISFGTDDEGELVIRIGEIEAYFPEAGKGAILREAILLNSHDTTGDLTLALEIKDRQIDYTTVCVLRIKNGKKAHTSYPDCSMRLVDGEVYFTEWCYVLGSISGTSLRQGALLRRVPPGWVETGVLDRVQNRTREEQIEYHDLIKVVRNLPCTIKDAPAVIEAGTWVYVLRWDGTRIVIRTEDGREATLEVQMERSDDGFDIARYLIDGVDAEDYFDNLDMAG